MVRRKKRSRRKVPYSRHGVPRKYDGGSKKLAAIIKRIAKLYKEGKRVPRSLIRERIRLGKRSLGKKAKRKTRRRR